MKILYLNHNVAWSGGTFFRAFAYARGLVARGHDVTLFSIAPSRRLGFSFADHEGVRIVETPDLLWGRGRSGWDPWDVINRVLALSSERRWDLVHSWDCRPVAILPALWARRKSVGNRVRLVTDWADWWGRGGTQGERPGAWMRAVWPIETFFEERFRSRADGTTVISSALRDRAVSLGLPPSRVRVLPQGCDPPIRPSRTESRMRLGVPGGTRLLLYVGRLNRSDADLLFPTIIRILNERSDSRFVMVGNHGCTIPRDLVQHPRFATTGVVAASVLADFIGACDVSIVPLAETLASRARWPSKINGFLSAGRAVVTTAVGDLPALLAREGAGLVTKPGVDSLVVAVSQLLDNATLQASVEESARRLAHGALSWTLVSEQLDEFYSTV